MDCGRRGTSKVSGSGISPRRFGGDPNGVGSSTDALNRCIREANDNGTTIDLSAGTWRVDGDLMPLTHAVVDGGGSGELYVDWAPPSNEPILDCTVPTGEVYAVTAIAVVAYDFEGVYSADSTMTRLTLSLTGSQVMPAVGEIGKLSSTDVLVGVEPGDSPGQHAYIAAVSGSFVYVPWAFVDSYATDMQLVMLKRNPVSLRGFGVRGNYADIVASDLLYTAILVHGAITPRLEDVRFRDLPGNGFMLVGTFMAQTRGCYGERMRNATASEAPAIPGYVGVDAGSWASVHFGLGGHDVRHVFTTVSPDASSWARVAWGRAMRPKLVGGTASACSAAAYDTHSDAYEPEFHDLTVLGGYYGQNSAGAGIQFRGVRGRAQNCRVHGTPVGYELYKQFAGEETGYVLDGCSYRGSGTAIRCEHADLTGGSERQSCLIRDFNGVTTGLIGLDLEHADVELAGEVRIIQTGSQAGPQAVFMRAPSTIRGETLVHDFSGATPTQEPRLISYQTAGDGAPGLKSRTIAGAVSHFGVLATNKNPDPVLTAGAFRIENDADAPAAVASGTYAQFGASSMPTAGSVQQKLSINGGQTVTRTANFALTAYDRSRRFLCTSALTVTIPAATVLGPDFDGCWIFAIGATVTIDGPAAGASNASLTAGMAGRVQVRGGVVVVQTIAAANLIDVST